MKNIILRFEEENNYNDFLETVKRDVEQLSGMTLDETETDIIVTFSALPENQLTEDSQ